MGVFGRKKIQATEGFRGDVDISDGITWSPVSSDVPGTTNTYRSYTAQVAETYRKYNGKSEWGNAQVRTIVDTRAAFIAGEGISLATKDERFAEWAKTFLKETRLSGSKFFSLVMAAEMSGLTVIVLKRKIGDYPSVEIMGCKVKNGQVERPVVNKLSEALSVVIKTGGDGTDSEETTTRTGLILNECETYDRAQKDLRRSNYYGARITPTWKTESDNETKSLIASIKKAGWRVGQGFIGKAALSFLTPGTGATDNLQKEMAAAAKTISAVSSIPVHWLGHTDLMSNRATADDLYQTISNGTSRERVLIAEGMYELLVKAQAAYIDSGGTEITTVTRDFTISIPSVDYGRFESMVRALSLAYSDGIISEDDYRAFIPGIDPLETKKALAHKEKADISDILDSLNEPEEGGADVTGNTSNDREDKS